jgi:molecular chaperone HtpG
MGAHSFTVDLAGIVELLSSHLYSGPQVFVRELLQNGVDAVSARREIEPDHVGRIEFRFDAQNPNSLTVTDDGVGLTSDEASMFMGVIGRSSKRDEIGMARESMIGQFGVGILSCFGVSDEIDVTSRSVVGSETVVWTGQANGTWDVHSESMASTQSTQTTQSWGTGDPFGTTVRLTARRGEERWFEPETVLHWLRHYGELIRVPLWFRRGADVPILINRQQVPTREPYSTSEEFAVFGRELLDVDPLHAFPVASRSGQVSGIAYVLPYEPSPSARRFDRVYVKGMLVSDQCQSVLPDWAFFVRGVFEADGLHPTASREDLHADELLSVTREELGESIRDHLLELATKSPAVLEQLIAVHHLSLAALAIADEQFLRLVGEWLPLETAEGRKTLGEVRRAYPVVTFARTVDEFRQAAPIARHQGVGLVNAGVVHAEGLLLAAAAAHDSFSATPVVIEDLFSTFGELGPDEVSAFAALHAVASDRLDVFGVDLAMKTFEPWESPSILAVSEGAAQLRSLRRLSEQSDDLFASVILAMQEHVPESRPLLCLNARNPIVQTLAAKVDQPNLVERGVEVLYLQALLAGHHPMRAEEMALLNTSILELLTLAAKS